MYEKERLEMVEKLERTGFVTSRQVLDVMRKVPRHEFIPRQLWPWAYVDNALPIGNGQTISAPHMVGYMLEVLDLHPGQKVLEIGTGSGYHAGLVAELVSPGGQVISLERIPDLGDQARKTLERLGYGEQVRVIIADGTEGLPLEAPFDRILVTAGGPGVPPPLKDQLKEGGILVIPVGGRTYQQLTVVKREGGKFEERALGLVTFVPLIGQHGHETS
ncbi:MAG: protein-L-isoaspartate(D-aspartate) O-methyltransferase [Methanomassiliicoccus sp.]|nr:protein-L-isoaspartate(D-aspartate) O-methyltransferase [Methanomassiliicoccus sp.]